MKKKIIIALYVVAALEFVATCFVNFGVALVTGCVIAAYLESR